MVVDNLAETKSAFPAGESEIAVVSPDISQASRSMLAKCVVIQAHASLGAVAHEETTSVLGEREVGWDHLSLCCRQFVLPY